MNDLVEKTQPLSDGYATDVAYYERLFSPYNDYNMCLDIVRDAYKDAARMDAPPMYDDLVADIACYNDAIIMELVSVGLMDMCPSCESRYDCWKGKEPWHADAWPDDDESIESCRSGEFEALSDYASYNYQAYEFDALLMNIIKDLGYSVGIDHFYWETAFGVPMPSHLPESYVEYFNDAQLALIPEMSLPSLFEGRSQLRLAGVTT